jgi:two-component system response regulator YesN
MDRKDKYLRLFKDVKEYINSHYAEPLSLERLSEMYGLSPGYFSRLFKEYVGESFVDHLTSCRLNVAKQMIRTGMKIREAAEVTGFSDYSYFSRVFRNSVGLSPRDFQKKLK